MATERREVVTVLTVDARQAQQAAQDHADALDKVVVSTAKVDAALGKTEQTLDASAKVTRRQANELENLLRTFDPLYGASQKLADSQGKLATAAETVDAQFRKGLITDEQRAQRMTLLAGKSAELKVITDDLAKGTIGHEEAMQRTVTVMQTHAQTTDKVAGSTKLAAWQVQNLSYQVQDFVTQVASGQGIFRPFMQQAPQAAEAVGGFGAALRMIVSPTGVAVAGVAALAGAMALVVTRAVSLNNQLKTLSSNATAFGNSSLTGTYARDFSNSMADNSPWFSRSQAQDATKYLQQVQALAGDTLRGIKSVASDFSHVTGQELAAGTKALADAFAKGYEGVKALDEQYNFLTADQLKAIRGFYQHGQAADGARLAMEAFTKQMREAADLSKGAGTDNFGTMVKAWQTALDTWAQSDAVQTALKLMQWAGEGFTILGGGKIGAPVDPELDALSKIQQAQDRLDKAKSGGGWSLMNGNRTGLELNDAQTGYDQAVQRWKDIVAQREQQRKGTSSANSTSAADATL